MINLYWNVQITIMVKASKKINYNPTHDFILYTAKSK